MRSCCCFEWSCSHLEARPALCLSFLSPGGVQAVCCAHAGPTTQIQTPICVSKMDASALALYAIQPHLDTMDAPLWSCVPSNNKTLHEPFEGKASFCSWRPPWQFPWRPQEADSTALFSSLHASKDTQHLNALHLDINGYNIAIDNCTTGHLTFTKDDFIANSYVEYNDIKAIEGVGSTTAAAGRGSVKWMMADENDELHQFILHNVNHVPTSPLQLLSPQQLSIDLGRHIHHYVCKRFNVSLAQQEVSQTSDTSVEL
jgi:hypothetical protein